jgi:hypothetical protein
MIVIATRRPVWLRDQRCLDAEPPEAERGGKPCWPAAHDCSLKPSFMRHDREPHSKRLSQHIQHNHGYVPDASQRSSLRTQ